MAVIRTVSKVVNYNMDINEEELLCILASICYRRKYVIHLQVDDYKEASINLITQIEGALKHG